MVYIFNILLLTVWAFGFLYPNKCDDKSRKTFIILASIQWIFLSGFRGLSVGADTRNYYNSFLQTISTPWSEIWDNFVNTYFKGGEGRDAGYAIFVKLCTMISSNHTVFLLIIATLFTVSMGYSIYKNSTDPYISFLLYSCLFYAFFAITGHRQTIATALVVFIGYEFIKKRKLIPFLLLTLIAYTIHKSAIVFLPMYFLYNFRLLEKSKFFVAMVLLLTFIFRGPFTSFVNTVSGYNYDEYSGSTGYVFIILFYAVTIMAFVYREPILKSKELSPDTYHYINALFVATFFCPVLFFHPSAMRVIQYYSVFLMYLFPEYIKLFKDRERTIAWLIFVALLIFLFVRGNPQYVFIWQE